jgi:hypothetical protein
MIVNLECACGATLNIDDASELAAKVLMAVWHQTHNDTDHRRTEQEWRDYFDHLERDTAAARQHFASEPVS